MSSTDIIVIGGGPAGYIAALKASQLGASVCLIERSEVGGTCLNRGCIPTKTHLHNAEIIAAIAQAAKRGIAIADPSVSVDLPKAVQAKDDVVRKLVTGIKGLLKARKVEVIQGNAVLVSPTEVMVDGTRKLTATKAVIVASGSKPARPPIPGAQLANVLTSDEMLALTEMPKSLVIVGAGVIGLEMAQIFRSYGAAVTLVEAEPRIAPFMDEELSKGLQASMTKRGIVFHVAAKVQEIVGADGCLAVKLADGTTLPASHVLIATGRQPDLSAFGTLPVVLNGKFVKVDATLQTSIPGVYAPGDANGLSMLAHAASKMGEIVAENALGHRRTFDATQVPGCIYGAPEAGWIGLTEAQARAQGEIEIGRFPFAANGRSLCSGHNEGFVKIITGKKHQEILGLHILGPHASDLINEAAVLRAMEITATELAEIIHAHPTHAETLMEAAADALGKCLHLPPRK